MTRYRITHELANLQKEDLLSMSEEIGEPAELAQFAARGAANWLVSNWVDALKSDYVLANLLTDIDETIEILRRWKEKLDAGIDTV